MSISRITLLLLLLALTAGMAAPATAQFPPTTHQFGGAGFWEQDHPGLVQPQIPLDYFQPDYQFFAPADVGTYGGYPEPNIGFFFSYERLYWNVQRSETDDAPYEGDFTWGNRVDFGYMMDTDHGWLVTAFHLDGPNASDNSGDFEGVEVNKTFRWKPVGKNYIIEPMFGARFMKFIDRDPEFVEIPDPMDPTIMLQQLVALNQVENNMLGGQLGVRIHHQTARWVTAIESRFVPAINYQFYPSQDYSEFVIYGQVGATATYKLTRDISIGTGFDIMHFGRGIARGRQEGVDVAAGQEITLPVNDQDLTIGGISIVFELNR
ncbi:MAG: hypothetical protein KY475_14095 [Planctomycetes bacterium]|nr:hypothetical protein [Planctomycetota bacterium]